MVLTCHVKDPDFILHIGQWCKRFLVSQRLPSLFLNIAKTRLKRNIKITGIFDRFISFAFSSRSLWPRTLMPLTVEMLTGATRRRCTSLQATTVSASWSTYCSKELMYTPRTREDLCLYTMHAPMATLKSQSYS